MYFQFNYRITKDGYFVVRSERTRSPHLNLADCLDKIRYTVRELETDIENETKQPTDEELAYLENK